jgi:transducin (beta)-like 1
MLAHSPALSLAQDQPAGFVGEAAAERGASNSMSLEHVTPASRPSKGRDVTTADWNLDGSMLATGCYDGVARLWSRTGRLEHSLEHSEDPILALKWNKRGDLLLSGSIDATTVVWNVANEERKQTFSFHKGAVLGM